MFVPALSGLRAPEAGSASDEAAENLRAKATAAPCRSVDAEVGGPRTANMKQAIVHWNLFFLDFEKALGMETTKSF